MRSIRIQIKALDWRESGGSLKARLPGRAAEIELPLARKAWMPLLDGSFDLRGLMKRLLETEGRLSFREILGTLAALEAAGLLEHPLGLDAFDAEESLRAENSPRRNESEGRTALSVPDLIRLLGGTSFFSDFPPELLERLASVGRVYDFDEGMFLLKQDDAADDFFMLLRGAVSVLKRRENGARSRVCVLEGPTVFGEAALATGARRTADVFSRSPGKLFVLSGDHLRQGLAEHRPAGFLDRVLVSQFLATAPLFRGVPHEALGLFSREGTMVDVLAGQDVFKEGDPGDAFYLVMRGSVQVLRPQTPPVTLGQGDCFGEVALFSGQGRSATVRAPDGSRVLRFGAPTFWEILAQNPTLGLHLEELAARRGDGEILTLT